MDTHDKILKRMAQNIEDCKKRINRGKNLINKKDDFIKN